jgi:anthranilate phosphoribosyltransferase
MASAALAIDSGAAAELLRRWASLTTALTEGA